MKFFYRYNGAAVNEEESFETIEFASFPNDRLAVIDDGEEEDLREFLESCILTSIEDGVPIELHESAPSGFVHFIELTDKDSRLITIYNYHFKLPLIETDASGYVAPNTSLHQHIASNLVYGLFSTGSELADWLDVTENELRPISFFGRKDFHKTLGSIDSYKDKEFFNAHGELLTQEVIDASAHLCEFIFYHAGTDIILQSMVLIPNDIPQTSEKIMVDIIAPIVVDLIASKSELLEDVPLIELSLLRYRYHIVGEEDYIEPFMDISHAAERDIPALLKRIDKEE